MSLLKDKRRFVLEVQSVRERWGDAPILDVQGNNAAWIYKLPIEGSVFKIKIAYPSGYPESPPEIYIIEPKIDSAAPHYYHSEKRLCWRYDSEGNRTRNMWNPATDTAAMCIGVAYRWLASYVVWKTLGEWVIPDARFTN